MYFLPYAEILLAHLALETLVLVMDGSVVGCGCVALMIHVLYKVAFAVGVARTAKTPGIPRGPAHR